jgi:hypothetical protein
MKKNHGIHFTPEIQIPMDIHISAAKEMFQSFCRVGRVAGRGHHPKRISLNMQTKRAQLKRHPRRSQTTTLVNNFFTRGNCLFGTAPVSVQTINGLLKKKKPSVSQ